MAAAKKPQTTIASSAKTKRGRPVGTTKVPRVKAKKYGPSQRLKALQKDLLPSLHSAFCLLPHEKQDELIREFLRFLPLVKESTFQRTFRYYSKRSKPYRTMEQMTEDEIYEIIRFTSEVTRDLTTQWALHPQFAQANNAFIHVVRAQKNKRTGQPVTALDKVEYCSIIIALMANLFSKYLTVLTREGVIEKGLSPASLDAIASATTAIDMLVKDEIFDRILHVWKKLGGIKGSLDPTRVDTINMAAATNQINHFADDIAHFKKLLTKLQKKIAQPIILAHEATRVKSTRGRKPKAKA